MKRGRKRSARQPHPDPLTELRLQRILGCQETITRYGLLIERYRDQMDAASNDQDLAAAALRNYSRYTQENFTTVMDAQAERIKVAAEGIAQAEREIAAQHEEIARLSAEIAPSDLAYL